MSSIDFEQRIKKLAAAPLCTREYLSIWGGRFGVERLGAFLDGWQLEQRQMPWRIWEEVSRIDFEWEKRPANPYLLERGRLFGPGGDLALRRDGDRFLWRFVGPADAAPPNDFGVEDYWDETESPLVEHQDQVLLWGKWRTAPDDWWENRVGQAKLTYPKMSGEERVWLDYRRYERAGQTAFVWYHQLRGREHPKQEVHHG